MDQIQTYSVTASGMGKAIALKLASDLKRLMTPEHACPYQLILDIRSDMLKGPTLVS